LIKFVHAPMARLASVIAFRVSLVCNNPSSSASFRCSIVSASDPRAMRTKRAKSFGLKR
jgi:hypothetical protein